MYARNGFGILRGLLRLRSGFRLRAQTRAKQLNFDSAPVRDAREASPWRFAQETEGGFLFSPKNSVERAPMEPAGAKLTRKKSRFSRHYELTISVGARRLICRTSRCNMSDI
jgi:hypothetical protein